MNRFVLHWILCLFIFAGPIISGCQTVPVTGREQLNLIPASEMNTMALDSYSQFLANHQVVEGTEAAQSVKRVGRRIQDAVERYMRQNGMYDRIAGYEWEFNLIKDDSANAWAMPGGKVAVYTGILPITENDTGLAVVMGHEIAHVIAQHGNERMSQGLLTQLGGIALQTALSQKAAQTQDLFMTAFGVGAQLGVLLPYSRLQESEADHLGLIFMAMAGYDPRAAVDFWQRMMAQKNGGGPPQFLSTHPSSQNRIENLKKFMPEALSYYRQ